MEDQLLLRIPDALSSPTDAAKALAVARYYLFGLGDVDSLLQVGVTATKGRMVERAGGAKNACMPLWSPVLRTTAWRLMATLRCSFWLQEAFGFEVEQVQQQINDTRAQLLQVTVQGWQCLGCSCCPLPVPSTFTTAQSAAGHRRAVHPAAAAGGSGGPGAGPLVRHPAGH